jgi:hypothetical protein
MGQNDPLLTAKEFATRSGLSVAHVTKMLREKKIKGHKQSGKWMIPASALKDTGDAPAPAKPQKKAPPKAAKPSAAAQGMSVSEFSAKTYLTEAGVIQWLKKGRLKGTLTPGGDWQVDAASLDLPAVKHLLRP